MRGGGEDGEISATFGRRRASGLFRMVGHTINHLGIRVFLIFAIGGARRRELENPRRGGKWEKEEGKKEDNLILMGP